MIDFDKMTVAEHEEYKEMQRKAEAWDSLKDSVSIASETMKTKISNTPNTISHLLMWTLILWVIIGILHMYDRLTGRDRQEIEITLLNKQEEKE